MSRARDKGTEYENRIVEYLVQRGLADAEREEFSSPKGDIKGLPVTIEVKNRNSLALSSYIQQAEKSDKKTGHGIFCIFHNRQNHHRANGYFTTTTRHGVTLLKAYSECVKRGIALDDLTASENCDNVLL